MLEKEIELIEEDHLQRGTGRINARSQAMEFIHEMGWLLHKYQLKSRYGNEESNLEFFPFERFKCLVEFSMEREWCSVVNKLLEILFSGTVSGEEKPFLKFAMSEMSLLHRAVRKNSRSLVAMLLRYVPEKIADELSSEYGSLIGGYLFRPDVAGPGGLTPLHVAAGRDGSEDILDALTDDPGKVTFFCRVFLNGLTNCVFITLNKMCDCLSGGNRCLEERPRQHRIHTRELCPTARTLFLYPPRPEKNEQESTLWACCCGHIRHSLRKQRQPET